MYNEGNFWKPLEKRSTRKDILSAYCSEHFIKQKQTEKMYRKKPNDILIRDCNGNYKVVSKYYYMYHMEEDEYDTETELVDEDFELEKQEILNKYNCK